MLEFNKKSKNNMFQNNELGIYRDDSLRVGSLNFKR